MAEYLNKEDVCKEISAYRKWQHIKELNIAKRKGIEYIDDFGHLYAPPMYECVKLSIESLKEHGYLPGAVHRDKYRQQPKQYANWYHHKENIEEHKNIEIEYGRKVVPYDKVEKFGSGCICLDTGNVYIFEDK